MAVLGQFVAQVGCGTVVIILAFLALGLWLDSQLATKPLFTLICLVGSIPFTGLVIWQSYMAVLKAFPAVGTTNPPPHDEGPLDGAAR
jgi:hypothetical protein